MKVVLDTNVLLVILPTQSKYHSIFQALAKGKYVMLISNSVYLEYLEIITQKSNPFIVTQFIDFVYKQDNIEVVDVYYEWNLITIDPDDNKFCDCAIAGKATYLVSNDAHFNSLKSLPFPKLAVISIDEFLKIVDTLP